MDIVDSLNVGLIIKNEDKKNQKILTFYNEVYHIDEFLKTIDSQIIHLAGYKCATYYVYLLNEVQESEKKTLEKILNHEKIICNKEKISFIFLYHINYKKEALRFSCICASLDIPCDIVRENVLQQDSSQLEFVKIFYDILAVSSATIKKDWGMIPKDLIDKVHREKTVPERFWYWHEGSTILWQKLNSSWERKESSSYELIRETTSLLKDHIEEIIELLLIDVNDFNSVDFIDLGVGTPVKDETIIIELFTQLQKKKGSIEVFFYPVDISFPLIEYTFRRILQIKNDGTLQGYNLNIIPIVGDFERLHETDYQKLLGEKRPKLITLLGNTIGNLSEQENLTRLLGILGDEGFLLIDVEFCDNIKDEDLKNQYTNKEVYDFVFHPLELIGGYDKGEGNESFKEMMDVQILTEKIEKKSEKHTDKKKSESDKKLYSFIDGEVTFNLGSSNVGKQHITDISKSKVVALFYKHKPNDTILMAWSTKYSKKEFEIFIRKWFSPIESWMNDDNEPRYGIYLLKKKREDSDE